MSDAPDALLLEQFAKNGSEEAFTEIVRRHIGLVHSVALRGTQNAQHAEEVTQAVFIILARKAPSLGRKTILSGWLYHTARLTAANFQRAEFRRVRREEEVFMQSPAQDEQIESAWQDLGPLLEEAMSKLGTTDRDAIVLRFFENKSLREVGTAMGLEERAAQKRVARGLEKLRAFLTKRGVTLSAAMIAGAVAANSVQAAPVGMLTRITATATQGVPVAASTLTLVKGTSKFMAWAKIKSVCAGFLVIALAAAVSVPIWSHSQNGLHHRSGIPDIRATEADMNPLIAANRIGTEPANLEATEDPPPGLMNPGGPSNGSVETGQADASWQLQFDAAYKLGDGEVLRYIPPPFIPERATYFHTEKILASQAKAIPAGPDMFLFKQDANDVLHLTTYGFGDTSLRHLIKMGSLGFRRFRQIEFEGDRNLLNIDLPGDWTLREATSRESILAALEPIIYKATGRQIYFRKETVEHDVLIARGRSNAELESVNIYAQKTIAPEGAHSYGDLTDLIGALGDDLGIYIVNESEAGPGPHRIQWVNCADADFTNMGERRVELSQQILGHFSEQTGLSFTQEHRAVEVWVIAEKK